MFLSCGGDPGQPVQVCNRQVHTFAHGREGVAPPTAEAEGIRRPRRDLMKPTGASLDLDPSRDGPGQVPPLPGGALLADLRARLEADVLQAARRLASAQPRSG